MNFYDGWNVHRLLISDAVRTRCFQESILATVKRGDVVLDVGAGSGILSLFAARAGARRVYAVERAAGAAALARRLAAENGFEGVIRVIESDAANAMLPEPVDVIVSEWLGVYGIDENMLWPVLLSRDRWLKQDGIMIPSRVTAWLAPAAHQAAQEAIQFRNQPYGLDLSALATLTDQQAIWLPRGVSQEALRAEPQRLWVTDCATMPAAEARRPHAAELSFQLDGDGVNGVAVWFSAEMPGAKMLSNAPGRPATHWGQFLFPIANAQGCVAGDRIEIGFHNVPAAVFGSHHLWASRVAGQPLEVHDTRRNPRADLEPPWRAASGQSAAAAESVQHA